VHNTSLDITFSLSEYMLKLIQISTITTQTVKT